MKAVFTKAIKFDITEMAKNFLDFDIDRVMWEYSEDENYEELSPAQKNELKISLLIECINILEKEAEKNT